jgi:hypothetical protein
MPVQIIGPTVRRNKSQPKTAPLFEGAGLVEAPIDDIFNKEMR